MTVATSDIAIYEIATGKIAVLAPKGTPLRQGQASVNLPVDYTPETWKWNETTRSMYEVPALVETVLVRKVKEQAEQRKMLSMTPGGAKKSEYPDKAAEVNRWESLAGSVAGILTAFNLLSTEKKAVMFPYALASAKRFGDTPQAAIARFKAGIARSVPVSDHAADEEFSTTKIRDAKTAAEKRAIFAAHGWSNT